MAGNEAVYLSGTVERVRYAKPPFYILVIKSGPHTYTVLGESAREPVPGDGVKGRFKRERHETYGEQYRALGRLQLTAGIEQRALEGLARLLEIHLDGVGARTAQAIIDRWGRGYPRALEDPKALQEIPGIGERKARQISESWRRERERILPLARLYEVGLTGRMLERAAEHFGGVEQLQRVLEGDVYALTRVPGIGFLTADQVARHGLGYAEDDPRRLRAVAEHLSWLAFDEGHTAPDGEILEHIGKRRMGLGKEEIARGIALAVEEGRLLARHGRYAPPDVYAVEDELVRLARRFLEAEPGRLRRRLEPAPEDGLTPAQARVFELVNDRSLAYLTGLPGTGKSHTLAALARAARRAGVSLRVLAPTGKAAVRLNLFDREMGAVTAHRALWPFPATGAVDPEVYSRLGNRLSGIDLVIVDEATMVDVSLMRALFYAGAPGYTRYLLVGDTNQLPPVGPGQPFADLVPHLEGVHLEEIFRQAQGNPIVAASHALARGEPFWRSVPADGAELRLELADEEALELEDLMRSYARLWEQNRVRPQVLVPGNRGPLGVVNLNRELKKVVNPATGQEGVKIGGGGVAHVGDPVIFSRNDYELRVMNGEQGMVTYADPDTPRLLVELGDQTVELSTPEQLEQAYLAYAITIHRAQGSQWPSVLIVYTTAHFVLLNRESLYTALTRAERSAWVWGSERALEVALKRRATARATWLPLLWQEEAA